MVSLQILTTTCNTAYNGEQYEYALPNIV